MLAEKMLVEKPPSNLGRQWRAQLQKEDDDKKLLKLTRTMEIRNPDELHFLLNYASNKTQLLWKTPQRAVHFSACFESFQQYETAIKLLQEAVAVIQDDSAIRNLLRISRVCGDYSAAEQILAKYPNIQKSDDFNMGYELIHYFGKTHQKDQAHSTLKSWEIKSKQSLSIQKTLKNLYLHFGFINDAKQVQDHIHILQEKNKGQPNKYTQFSEEVQESEKAVTSTVEELHAKLELQTRIAAISDLAQGITHEFGQPLTNIRFIIQMQQRILPANVLERVNDTFQSILKQTERIGGLIKRLAPITSTNKVVEQCNLVERIQRTIDLNKERLQHLEIKASVMPKIPLIMRTDPVMFDQIINNLLLNAVDAIQEKTDNNQRRVDFSLSQQENSILIVCMDTGIGVPKQNHKILFDPFFTTKDPGKGEGLGLYIIWNLLKSLGGSILLDPDRTEGACFIITLPKES